jgi:hypothetical protein
MNGKWFVALALALPAMSHAAAFDVFAHVSEIEPTYVPNNLALAIDKNAGACPAGPWLFYNGAPASNNLPENIKAMYAGLMTAMQTGTLIEVTGDDNGCIVTDIHFLNHP